MTGRDGSGWPGPDSRSASNGPRPGADVLEQGSQREPGTWWRPQALAVLLAAAALVIGFATGYAVRGRPVASKAGSLSRSQAAASAAAASAAGSLALEQNSAQCSAQVGRLLQLGVQVTNQSAASVTLRRVIAILPLGGLKTVSQSWGPCGELPVAGVPPGNTLPAGASAWFTVTFRVLLDCPAPLPVQFTVDYVQLGRPASGHLPGFADLSHVPYTSCTAT